MLHLRALFRELCPDYHPRNDPWGHAMGGFFDVAAEMDLRDLPIPSEWGYRAGAGGPEVSDEARPLLESLPDETLYQLGELLHRLTERLDRQGRSY